MAYQLSVKDFWFIMPGAVISQLLASQDYTSFFNVTYWYSDMLLSRVYTVKSSGEVIQLFAHNIPPDETTKRVGMLKESSGQLAHRATQLAANIYRFFWPVQAAEVESAEAFHHYYSDRWYPYDEMMWDQVFDDLQQLVNPWVNHLAGLTQSLYLLSSGRMPEAHRESTRADYQRVNQITIETAHKIDDVRQMISHDSLDEIALLAWFSDEE